MFKSYLLSHLSLRIKSPFRGILNTRFISYKPVMGITHYKGFSSEANASKDFQASEVMDHELKKASAPLAENEKSEKVGGVSERVKTDRSKVCFVGNVPWSIDESTLGDVFSKCGTVTDVRIITDKETGRPRGYGYVTFDSCEAAVKALEVTGTEVEGRALRVELPTPRAGKEKNPPSCTLFMGNLSFECTEEIVRNAFAHVGEVVQVRFPTHRDTGRPKGFGYVVFGNIETAKAAFEAMNGVEVAGRNIRLDFATERTNTDRANSFTSRGSDRGNSY